MAGDPSRGEGALSYFTLEFAIPDAEVARSSFLSHGFPFLSPPTVPSSGATGASVSVRPSGDDSADADADLSAAGAAAGGAAASAVAAAGGSGSSSSSSEPFALQAKLFTELRLLNREVPVRVVGFDARAGALVGVVLHPMGDVSVALVREGLARINERTLSLASK